MRRKDEKDRACDLRGGCDRLSSPSFWKVTGTFSTWVLTFRVLRTRRADVRRMSPSFFSAFNQTLPPSGSGSACDGCSQLRGDAPAVIIGLFDPPHVPTGVAVHLGNPRAHPRSEPPQRRPARLRCGRRVRHPSAGRVFTFLLFLRLLAFSSVSGSFRVVPSPGMAVALVVIQRPFRLLAWPRPSLPLGAEPLGAQETHGDSSVSRL